MQARHSLPVAQVHCDGMQSPILQRESLCRCSLVLGPTCQAVSGSMARLFLPIPSEVGNLIHEHHWS
jgi:hypothetical protein